MVPNILISITPNVRQEILNFILNSLQVFGCGAFTGWQLRVCVRSEAQHQRWAGVGRPLCCRLSVGCMKQTCNDKKVPTYQNLSTDLTEHPLFSVRSGLLSTLVGEKSVTQRWEVRTWSHWFNLTLKLPTKKGKKASSWTVYKCLPSAFTARRDQQFPVPDAPQHVSRTVLQRPDAVSCLPLDLSWLWLRGDCGIMSEKLHKKY